MQLRGIGKELNFIDNLADKLKAIESLQKRSLIDTNSCSQDKILHIYVLQDLLAESAKEISNPDLQAIVSYILQEILWTEELTILEEQ
ncbi:MAG: hypothetical protein D6756_07950 [Cyanobacteria bacterium J083]|nr:MAG: hypothetical protein D6756_07950 [Cyanobacteria bacterium J083]